MYSMLNRSPLGVDPQKGLDVESSLQRRGKAARWRGYLAALELFGTAAFVIAAPLADREFVPATFVDQIGAAFDANSPDDGGFTLAETAGEPAISMATAPSER
jgi:hypothetical protein